MQLYLKGFQKYDEATFTFPSRSVVYIEGENGMGKSTIFRAIYWILYGKVRKISNWRSPDSSVTCILRSEDGMSITRTKKPKTLSVVLPNQSKLTGNVAQEYINSLYGHAETWLSTSYLIQDTYHPLISFDPATRMKMLNKIAFDGDDPTEKIEKLSFAIKEHERKVAVLSAEEKSTYALYMQVSNGVQPDDTHILSQNQYSTFVNELHQLNYKMPNMQSQLADYNVIRGKFDAYTDMLTKQINLLGNNFPSDDELVLKKNQLQEYQAYCSKKKEHDELQKKLLLLSKNHHENNDLPDFTAVEISKLTALWNEYTTNEKLCSNMSINYTQDDVNKTISESERIRDNQWLFNSTTKITQLSSRIEYIKQHLLPEPSIAEDDAKERLNSSSVDSITTKITELRNELSRELLSAVNKHNTETNAKIHAITAQTHEKKQALSNEYALKNRELTNSLSVLDNRISELEGSRCIHSCPHCQKSIRLVNAKLEKSDASSFNESEYVLTMNERRKLLSYISKQKSQESQQLSLYDSEASLNIKKVLSSTLLQETEKNIRAEYQAKIVLNEMELQKVKSTISELTSVLKLHEDRKRQLSEISKLESELRAIDDVKIPEDVTHLSPEELGNLNNKIYTLKQVKFVDKPTYTVEQAKKSHLWHHNQIEIEKIKSQLSKIELIKVEEITSAYVADIEAKVKERIRLTNSIEELKKSISGLGEKPDTESLVNNINSCSYRINELNILLRNSERMSRIKDAYTAAWNKHLECKESMERLTSIREMYNLAIETQTQIHYSLIKSINSFLASVTSILFDEPISVTINTVKQNKMGNEVSCVNLRINYQGKEDRDIDSLSGGEKRIISTLISLAFSGLFSTKMIILDESMACLSPDKRDAMMKVIKHAASDRIILVTCHGIHRGTFDHVIKL